MAGKKWGALHVAHIGQTGPAVSAVGYKTVAGPRVHYVTDDEAWDGLPATGTFTNRRRQVPMT